MSVGIDFIFIPLEVGHLQPPEMWASSTSRIEESLTKEGCWHDEQKPVQGPRPPDSILIKKWANIGGLKKQKSRENQGKGFMGKSDS